MGSEFSKVEGACPFVEFFGKRMLRSTSDFESVGEVVLSMALQVKKVRHTITCDCGAKLEMTAVTTWEEGKLDSTRQEIEGREFWQHMLHCLGE